MAYENPKLHLVGVEASGDLSSDQFKAVVLDGSGQAAVAAASTDVVVGVLQDKPAAQGRSASVATAGVSKVVAGAATTAGAKAMSDGSGRAIDWITGNHAFGVFREAAGGAGELVSVELLPYGVD